MRRVRLGDVCEVVSGSTPKTNIPEYWDGDKDWITPAELSDDSYVINDSVRKITDLGVQKTGLKAFPKGTVILSSRAPIGKVAIAGKSMYCNQGFKNLICSEAIIPEYLYWYLKGNTEYLNSLGRGATFKEISKKIVENIEIALPDKERQEHAVAVLVKCWEVMQKRKAELTQLDELIKARFVEMFGDQGDNPLGFEVGTLKDVADIYLGLTHTPTYVDSGRPFLSVRDISSGTIDFSNCHYITEEEFQSLPKGARPMANDLIFCRVGTIGKPVIVPEGIPEFGSFVSIGFLRKKENVLNEYLKSWMEDPFFMKQVYDNVAGASQINLNTGWLKNFRIIVPPLDLQKQFAAFVEQVDKSKVIVQKALDEAQLLFNSLMQQYFG